MDVAIPTATYLSIGRSGLLWFYVAALVPGRLNIYFRIAYKFKDCIESIFVVLHYIYNLRIGLNQYSWYWIKYKI